MPKQLRSATMHELGLPGETQSSSKDCSKATATGCFLRFSRCGRLFTEWMTMTRTNGTERAVPGTLGIHVPHRSGSVCGVRRGIVLYATRAPRPLDPAIWARDPQGFNRCFGTNRRNHGHVRKPRVVQCG